MISTMPWVKDERHFHREVVRIASGYTGYERVAIYKAMLDTGLPNHIFDIPIQLFRTMSPALEAWIV